MALGYESGGWRTCFDEKNQRQNLSYQCPFKRVNQETRWVRFMKKTEGENLMTLSLQWMDLKTCTAHGELLTPCCFLQTNVFFVHSIGVAKR